MCTYCKFFIISESSETSHHTLHSTGIHRPLPINEGLGEGEREREREREREKERGGREGERERDRESGGKKGRWCYIVYM